MDVRTPAANPMSMVVGDFNQDGKLDLATLNGPGVRGVSVLLGQGDGTFAHAPSSDSSVYATAFATGDLDNDGKLDLVLTEVSRYYYGYQSTVEVMLGHGDGTFGSNGGASYDGYLSSPRLADVNGDGNLDVAAPGTVLLGNGDGTLQDPTPLAGVDLWSKTADFNADGNLDLVSRGNTSLGVSLGNGDGSYSPPITTPLGSNPSSLATADFNGDGRPDVAVTMLYQNKVSVLLNDGHWSPGDPPTVSVRDATLTEGNTGTANATFTVVLSIHECGCDGPLLHGEHHGRFRQRLHRRFRNRDHPGRSDQQDVHHRGEGRPPPRADRSLRRQPQRRDECDHRRCPGDWNDPR